MITYLSNTCPGHLSKFRTACPCQFNWVHRSLLSVSLTIPQAQSRRRLGTAGTGTTTTIRGWAITGPVTSLTTLEAPIRRARWSKCSPTLVRIRIRWLIWAVSRPVVLLSALEAGWGAPLARVLDAWHSISLVLRWSLQWCTYPGLLIVTPLEKATRAATLGDLSQSHHKDAWNAKLEKKWLDYKTKKGKDEKEHGISHWVKIQLMVYQHHCISCCA